MRNIVNNLHERFSELNGITKLIIYIILVILLSFAVKGISNISFESTMIDYKNITGKDLQNQSVECKDRAVYVVLDNIIRDFLSVEFNGNKINDKIVSVKDYYNYALDKEYKANMSFSKFNKKVNNLYSNIYVEEKKYDDIPLDEVINSIYTYSDSLKMYLVKLNTNTNIDSYIGIKFSDTTNNYWIFYVE